METNQSKIAVQKLAILYFLHKAGRGVNERRLADACSTLALMDYFSLKVNLHDICENHLAEREDAIHGRFYTLTYVGSTTLGFFIKELLHSTRKKIDDYCETFGEDIRLDACVFAEYARVADDQYRVILRILENSVPVFELSFFATSRAEADKYLTVWRKKAMVIYETTFENLLS